MPESNDAPEMDSQELEKEVKEFIDETMQSSNLAGGARGLGDYLGSGQMPTNYPYSYSAPLGPLGKIDDKHVLQHLIAQMGVPKTPEDLNKLQAALRQVKLQQRVQNMEHELSALCHVAQGFATALLHASSGLSVEEIADKAFSLARVFAAQVGDRVPTLAELAKAREEAKHMRSKK